MTKPKPKTTRKASTHERLNWWKVTATILVVGGLCWLALALLTGCAAVSFGKGDVKQNVVIFGRTVETNRVER